MKKIARVDKKSRRLDNVQLYTAGLLGDERIGHRFLQALDSGNENKKEVFIKRAKDYLSHMNASSSEFNNDGDNLSTDEHSDQPAKSKLTRLQLIKCAHEGKLHEMVDTVAQAVLVGGNTLDLSEIDGGLLPHHLSSIGYFIDQSKGVQNLVYVSGFLLDLQCSTLCLYCLTIL